MKLKQLSKHFTFWNKVWATHLTDADSDHQVNEQAINEIILRRGKSLASNLGDYKEMIKPKMERRVKFNYDKCALYSRFLTPFNKEDIEDCGFTPIEGLHYGFNHINPMNEAVKACSDSLAAKHESLIAEVLNKYCDDHSIEFERLKADLRVNTDAHNVERFYIQNQNGKEVNLISFYPYQSRIDDHKEGAYYFTSFGRYEIHYTGAGND